MEHKFQGKKKNEYGAYYLHPRDPPCVLVLGSKNFFPEKANCAMYRLLS